MATKEQSITLLCRNKRAQVEALQGLGFKGVSENTRASEFPMYIKWAAGLYDLCVAAVKKDDKTLHFFEVDSWLLKTEEEQNKYIKLGLRVRANCMSFIIAASTIGNLTFSGNKDVAGVTNVKQTAQTYNKCKTDTEIIVNFLKGVVANSVTGAPAAEAAWNYKAFTLEADGIEDTSQWHLPAILHLRIIYSYRDEIDDALFKGWGSNARLVKGTHWSCVEADTSNAWAFNLNTGSIYTYAKSTSKYSVLPIIEL